MTHETSHIYTTNLVERTTSRDKHERSAEKVEFSIIAGVASIETETLWIRGLRILHIMHKQQYQKILSAYNLLHSSFELLGGYDTCTTRTHFRISSRFVSSESCTRNMSRFFLTKSAMFSFSRWRSAYKCTQRARSCYRPTISQRSHHIIHSSPHSYASKSNTC